MTERSQLRGPLAVLCLATLGLLPTLAGAATVRPNPPAKLCIDAKNCVGATDPSSGIKWHPGHYMMLRGSHKYVPGELAAIAALKGEASVKGVLVDFKWSTLETGKGVYDFSMVDQYLNQTKAAGKRFIIRVENRGFGGTTGIVTPSYLRTESVYLGGQVPMASGVVARIWDAPVMDRLIALHKALAAKYDSDPSVEGISTSETAIGWSAANPAPSTYSATALLTQLQRLVSAERDTWSRSNVFCETNYLGSDTQMEALVKSCGDEKAFVGGPDVVPGRNLQADNVVRGDTGAVDYRGVIAIKAEVQSSSLGVRWTLLPADLYAQAVTTNKANYMFWDRNTTYGGPAQKWDTGLLPFIRSVNGKTVADCPSSFAGACKTN
ncbi:MAG: hypothetical protein ACJ8R9_22685 [Steroidobacteraceae bacterium]